MKHARQITLLLLSALLLPLAAACGNEAATEQVTQGIGSSTEGITETEEVRAQHAVPAELDFGGENFHVINSVDFKKYHFAEEETGESMNDAVYRRRMFVEETLNVTLSHYEVDITKVYPEVSKTYRAGDDAYDFAMTHCISGVSELVTNGFLYDYNELPYIDLNADWWNYEMMEQLQLGQTLCYGFSDFQIPNPYVIIFNRDMVTNFNLSNPYQLVYDGTWTLDNFITMCTTVVSDLDGDGKMTLNDNIGVGGVDGSLFSSFMTGAGQYVSQKGADGKVEIVINNERTYTIVEKMHSLMETPGAMWLAPGELPNMASGRILFYMGGVHFAETMRDVDVEIGILPYPKLDETQEKYMTLDWGGLTCVPGTITNPEMVGAVLELLAWDSANGVIPAYYDLTLAGKLARDDDCRNMLDLIFDTLVYDVGLNYFGFANGFNSMLYTIHQLVINKKSADFASFYAKNEKSAQKTIDKFYEMLESTEGAT